LPVLGGEDTFELVSLRRWCIYFNSSSTETASLNQCSENEENLLQFISELELALELARQYIFGFHIQTSTNLMI